MTETLKNIYQRYSSRGFKDAALNEGQIENLVNAALAAPSARNLQPWHIVTITDKAKIDALDKETMEQLSKQEDKSTYNLMMERGGSVFYNTPFLMLILAEEASQWAMLDCGIQCQNVVLAAESMGLGSVILGMAAIPFGAENAEKFQKEYKFPKGYKFAIGVAVGETAKPKEPHGLDKTKVTYIK